MYSFFIFQFKKKISIILHSYRFSVQTSIYIIMIFSISQKNNHNHISCQSFFFLKSICFRIQFNFRSLLKELHDFHIKRYLFYALLDISTRFDPQFTSITLKLITLLIGQIIRTFESQS